MGVELFYPRVKNKQPSRNWRLFVNENEILITTLGGIIAEDEKGRTFPMDNLRMFELVRDGQISNGKISGYWTFRKGVAKKNTLKYVPSISINTEVVNYEDWLTLQGLYGLVDMKILVNN
jgi:hypothetical protein